MKNIFINGYVFHHGDHVTAVLNTDSIDDKFSADFVEENLDSCTITVNGILYVKDDNTCYICQDVTSGDNSFCTEFGKAYSWYVFVRGGDIVSSDTLLISPKYKTQYKPAEITDFQYDDDPMPDDWKLPFPIPEHL